MKHDEVKVNRSPSFRGVIEQALGPDVLQTLQDVVFEDDPDFGAAMAFDFQGESYWLEHEGGGFLSLGRLCDEGDICMLHPKSNQFKEQFLNALIVRGNREATSGS